MTSRHEYFESMAVQHDRRCQARRDQISLPMPKWYRLIIEMFIVVVPPVLVYFVATGYIS